MAAGQPAMHQQAAQTPTVSSPSNSYPLENFIETRGFRPEIQGLRAFAVLLVVLYHVWFGRVSGGVDVFLFISAFLLSLSNMRKSTRAGRLTSSHTGYTCSNACFR